MNKEQQQIAFEEIVFNCREIMLNKGDDYANEDRLSNFKLAGSIVGLNAELNCLSLIATKVARLGVLFNGNIPKNESVDDSIDDLINYSILLKMIKKDGLHTNEDKRDGAVKQN